MTTEDRLKMAETIGDRIKAELLFVAKNAPEDWDGFEIRWALEELAKGFQFKNEPRHMGRLRAFRRVWRNEDMSWKAMEAVR